jgi:hypothetical protein
MPFLFSSTKDIQIYSTYNAELKKLNLSRLISNHVNFSVGDAGRMPTKVSLMKPHLD